MGPQGPYSKEYRPAGPILSLYKALRALYLGPKALVLVNSHRNKKFPQGIIKRKNFFLLGPLGPYSRLI